MVLVKILEPIGLDDGKYIEQLRSCGARVEVADTRGKEDAFVAQFIQGADAVILANRPLRRLVIEACPTLQLISTAFTGLDHIDLAACQERGIVVKNASGYAVHAVAELTVALALNLYRNIAEAEPTSIGHELYGKKVGLIGGGSIGQEVAKRFSAFGCDVSIYSRSAVPPVAIERLLTSSDIVSLHIPYTAETKHFLNKERLALMKPSAILINTARGPVIDQTALVAMIKKKAIAGVALDVFDDVPPLPQQDNVLLTPHIGYRTQEAFARRSDAAFKSISEWLVTQTALVEKR